MHVVPITIHSLSIYVNIYIYTYILYIDAELCGRTITCVTSLQRLSRLLRFSNTSSGLFIQFFSEEGAEKKEVQKQRRRQHNTAQESIPQDRQLYNTP